MDSPPLRRPRLKAEGAKTQNPESSISPLPYHTPHFSFPPPISPIVLMLRLCVVRCAMPQPLHEDFSPQRAAVLRLDHQAFAVPVPNYARSPR